jgi:hypothetical protein
MINKKRVWKALKKAYHSIFNRFLCIISWCSETKQNTQNFEIQVPKGTPPVKVFEILVLVLSCLEGRI